MSLFLQWFAMRGYACYIWSAYGLVLGVFICNIISIIYLGRRTRKQLQHWFKRSV
jgi:heme exporter protein CcmD